MNYITGSNRAQMEFSCLEDAVEQDYQVRFLETFVAKLDWILQLWLIRILEFELISVINNRYNNIAYNA